MSSKNNIYATAIAFIVAAACLAVFLIYPAWRSIQKTSESIFSAKGQAMLAVEQQKALDDFKTRYQEYQPNLEEAEKSFVDSKDPIAFITFLERIASISNVNVAIALAPSAKETGAVRPLVSVFQISVKGGFLSVAAFAEQLEKGPYLAKIYSMVVKKSDFVDSSQEKSYDGVDAQLLIEALAK